MTSVFRSLAAAAGDEVESNDGVDDPDFELEHTQEMRKKAGLPEVVEEVPASANATKFLILGFEIVLLNVQFDTLPHYSVPFIYKELSC